VDRASFSALLDGWLAPAAFHDVAENGLQVEGRDRVQRVVCGVSANLALLEAAAAANADAVVVHHGLVWGGGIRKIDGWLKRRVALLVEREINLFAYHLPLDAQPELGNNAGVARAIGLEATAPFGKYKGQLIGLRGRFASPIDVDELVVRVRNTIGEPHVVFRGTRRSVSTLAVCTGGAPELLHDVIGAGLDGYLTGEVTEWVQAVAAESGCLFIGAGHHATERFGPRALAERLRAHDLDATFVDVENPA
jgi:dinuclear metal center YbgI/SA1388 family protein